MASSDPSSGGDEREVLSGLPNARPHRRSAKRDRPARAAATTKVPAAGYATPRADDGVPRGADLIGTAVQAAGELAHIGISAGGRALKSAIQRLPRP
jgi:hypothetical protein